MRVLLDTGVNKDLTDAQIKALDAKLRARIPQINEWSYSPITGELFIDVGETDDSALLMKLQSIITNADCVAIKGVYFKEELRERLA